MLIYVGRGGRGGRIEQLVRKDGFGDKMLGESEGRGGHMGNGRACHIKLQCFLCIQQVCRERVSGRGYKVISP